MAVEGKVRKEVSLANAELATGLSVRVTALKGTKTRGKKLSR